MASNRAAGRVGIPQARSDDENFSLAADGHSRLRLVTAATMVISCTTTSSPMTLYLLSVLSLEMADRFLSDQRSRSCCCLGSKLPQAPQGESGAVGLHLREDDGDRGGGEDPAPPSVMVSDSTPRVAAALASLSALLPPMKRAGMSSYWRTGLGMIASSRDRFGRVSMDNLYFVQSSARRG